MKEATDDTVEQAFNDGTILRTHVLRPTWHFVTPADIRWMLQLTGPRVNAGNGSMYRRLELDEALLQRSNAILARALEGGRSLTRLELGSTLAAAGISAKGMRLGYILHRAELDAVICSGPRRGRQFTYALLDERAPRARTLAREEALAELTRRYYTGHGPATLKDFTWWSSLTVADVKEGLQLAAPYLAQEVVDGITYWFSASQPPAAESTRSAFLLPTYDEFVIGYSMFNKSRLAGQDVDGKIVFDSMIVIGGRIAGSWRRTFQKGAAVIEIAPFAPLDDSQGEALTTAAVRYGDFLDMPVMLHFV